MIDWIKKKAGNYLNRQEDYFHTQMLGVSEMDRSLIMIIARHYPHSYKELLKAYATYGRSIDRIRKACEDAQRYNMDLYEALRLNISPN